MLLRTSAIKFHTTLDLVSDVKSLSEASMTYERNWPAYFATTFPRSFLMDYTHLMLILQRERFKYKPWNFNLISSHFHGNGGRAEFLFQLWL